MVAPSREKQQQRRTLVVIGGGISGLSAAYYAQEANLQQSLDVDIVLVEAGERFGGKIQTLHRNGFIMEQGPDSFLARKQPVIDLTKALHLEDELVATNPAARQSQIWHQNQLYPMPHGFMLGIPTQFAPFMKTKLISFSGKLRAALDFVKPRRRGEDDESLGDFLRRRLGREVVDNIAEPLLSGIYAGDAYDLSLLATFPQFRELEVEHRSLILGMLASKKLTKQATNSSTLPDKVKNSVFLSFRNGLSTLVDGLVSALGSVQKLTGQSVLSVERNKEINQQSYRVTFEDGHVMEASAVILTTPLYVSAKLLSSAGSSPLASIVKPLRDVEYVSVANVVMAFQQGDIRYPLHGSGFVVPRKEGRFITACTWVSSKWKHAAPRDKILLRCYVGRSGDEEWMSLSNEEMLANVLHDLKEIMGVDAKPSFYEVNRWPRSMPQYPLGHRDHIQQLRNQLAEVSPGLFVTGAGFQGVGIPDCIRQGKEAAEQASDFLLAHRV